jgi:hypothetical protein
MKGLQRSTPPTRSTSSWAMKFAKIRPNERRRSMSAIAIYRQLGHGCWEECALATVHSIGVVLSTNVHFAEKHRIIRPQCWLTGIE